MVLFWSLSGGLFLASVIGLQLVMWSVMVLVNFIHHSDKMSQWSQVPKVTLCVEILKWQSVSQYKGRYRGARAVKNVNN